MYIQWCLKGGRGRTVTQPPTPKLWRRQVRLEPHRARLHQARLPPGTGRTLKGRLHHKHGPPNGCERGPAGDAREGGWLRAPRTSVRGTHSGVSGTQQRGRGHRLATSHSGDSGTNCTRARGHRREAAASANPPSVGAATARTGFPQTVGQAPLPHWEQPSWERQALLRSFRSCLNFQVLLNIWLFGQCCWHRILSPSHFLSGMFPGCSPRTPVCAPGVLLAAAATSLNDHLQSPIPQA